MKTLRNLLILLLLFYASISNSIDQNYQYSQKELVEKLFSQNIKEVAEAIEAGIDINIKDLHKRRVISRLYKNIPADYGNTALIWAVFDGNQEIVNLLIEKKANLDIKNHNGCNALMLAIVAGHEQIAALLINAGTDLAAENKDGQTALQMARARGLVKLIKKIIRIQEAVFTPFS